ncbi:ribonuclease R [Cardinium endosymbiont of Oedothorax gibbosus]|uniref:ribonuclease R n=1 Tax=Cardinium endosymbiont of Oedothorax gibbosus TaxID=931101 RepID=UPI0020247200|nr:ribonuclease R [Cardinium endosymbiont of Oedothorax gibbosus]CAH2560209.1 Ribonuclease R [Cardinium endosymbiont of Oedothorax gibbosus]
MQNYTTPIVTTLQQDPNQAYTLQQLYRVLKVTGKSDRAKVKKALLDLLHEGTIKKVSKGGYLHAGAPIYITGRVDYVRAEYAYIVAPDQPKDVLVRQKDLLSALDKDLVKVCLFPSRRGKRPEGVVVEIIERNTASVIGRITVSGNQPQAIVQQKRTAYTVLLEQENSSMLQENDKVVIAFTSFPNAHNQLTGKVVQHLGEAGLHEVEMHAIMAEFGLKDTFPESVLEHTKNIPTVITEAEISKRRDLRHIPTFTIDPVDAKDFDDALSYQPLANGAHQVGIHIADVSYYVLPDSPLDREAYARNTSVYLVDRCIPMLPELLSNELCSLRPNETKLTFSAIFELDAQGKIYDKWLGETIIYSNKRFTYEEAQAAIDAQTRDCYQALTVLNNLAKQLRAKRLQKGAINFETRELVFELDANGKPLDMVPKVRTDAHKLIEEFMLLANKEVATYVAKLKQKQEKLGPTFIYRTHDHPDPDKLDEFFLFVIQLGYKINTAPIYKAMHDLERAIQGKQEENIIQSLAIRSMAKALYTTKPNPHFALAFAHYTHFTSPIRRYSDVLVHRLLKKYLKGERIYDVAFYEKKCQYAVEREYLAANAERASIKYKQVEFIQNLKDEIFEGIISGLTEWNIYIEILSNGCEGMVRLSDLTDDSYTFKENNFQVIGKHTKKCYRLGDIVKVKVKNCDLDKRHINFWLC